MLLLYVQIESTFALVSQTFLCTAFSTIILYSILSIVLYSKICGDAPVMLTAINFMHF